MKRYPECRRDYYDETSLYCLDDGNAPLDGRPGNVPSIGKTIKLKATLFVVVILFCAAIAPAQSPYLFVWAGDADGKDPDFLAVIDARADKPTYGAVAATLPVGRKGTVPHHTEYEFPAKSVLFANGWEAGETFLIDVRNPRKPKLAGQFGIVGDYAFPHSYARLPNGNILATFQVKKSGNEPPGALVELDANGKMIRSASADVAGFDKKKLWPYSLLVLPTIDRVITTNMEMGLPKSAQPGSHSSHQSQTFTDTEHIQIWSLKDLRLFATIPLPPQPNSKVHLNPAEPRRLPDGTVYVNTFGCGLYRVSGLSDSSPKAEWVYSFPGVDKTGFECAVPVVVGKFWIQTDASLPGLVALDISDPAKPVEVSRLVFDKRFDKSHWIAADRNGDRLVVTGHEMSWVLIVNFDPKTGRMTVDEKLRAKGANLPGIDFDRASWPHGSMGKAVVHGALFGPAR